MQQSPWEILPMPYQLSPAIERLVRERMATGHYASEEEVLLEALQSLDDSDSESRAIERGLQSVDNGEDGVSVDEAFARLREKYPRQD